jgi:hypothetical protein
MRESCDWKFCAGEAALRAGKSLQLAAALARCGGRRARRVLLCGDARLSEAARAEGFRVTELPRSS